MTISPCDCFWNFGNKSTKLLFLDLRKVSSLKIYDFILHTIMLQWNLYNPMPIRTKILLDSQSRITWKAHETMSAVLWLTELPD